EAATGHASAALRNRGSGRRLCGGAAGRIRKPAKSRRAAPAGAALFLPAGRGAVCRQQGPWAASFAARARALATAEEGRAQAAAAPGRGLRGGRGIRYTKSHTQ